MLYKFSYKQRFKPFSNNFFELWFYFLRKTVLLNFKKGVQFSQRKFNINLQNYICLKNLFKTCFEICLKICIMFGKINDELLGTHFLDYFFV